MQHGSCKPAHPPIDVLLSTANQASAQSLGELRVLIGGGDVGTANIEAYVKPLQAETGIKVTPITD